MAFRGTKRSETGARWFLLSALVFLASSGASALAQSPAALADGSLCSRLVDGHRPGVRDTIARAVAASDAARAAFLRGCLAFADDRPDDAASEFQHAVRLNDGDAVKHLWLGRAYGEQAQHANVIRQALIARRARTEFERTVALAPDYLDGHQALMQYALQAPGMLGGSAERARSEAAEITRRNPYRGAFARVIIARHDGNHVVVEQIDRELVARYPDSVAPRLELIAELAAQRRWSDEWAVADEFERALPRAASARFAVGRVAGESGQQLSRGARALREYLAHEPLDNEPQLSRAHWRLGVILERNGQVDAARQEYQAAVALEPKLRPAREALARLK
jgi:tetratricopeptide (TPR) repeat protein